MSARDLPAPLADLISCVGFFTRLPMPYVERSLASALWAAPLAGVLVGLFCGLALLACLALGLAPMIAAVAAVSIGILVTGALHEDGAADTADGFGGGRDRERKLAIMRDSRIGSYGTLALILSVLARWSAIVTLATMPWTAFFAIVAAHAASRAMLPAFMLRVPPARVDGLAAGVSTISVSTAATAIAIGIFALLPLGPMVTLTAVALLAVLFVALERLTRAQIGGQTGDVLGALQQAAEIAILLAACALLM